MIVSALILTSFVSSPISISANPGLNKPSFTQDKQYSRGMWRGGRTGGGARTDSNAQGICGSESSFTALVPEFKDSSHSVPVTYVGGLTSSEHPTLWFYIPYEFNSQPEATFIFQNQDAQELYRISSTEFAKQQQVPGVVGISLPSTVTLELGQTYRWYLKVDCGSKVINVSGGIERILPEAALIAQLASLSPREQAELYQQHDLWYDALTVIATNLAPSSTERTTEADWHNLLESIGLRDIPAPASKR